MRENRRAHPSKEELTLASRQLGKSWEALADAIETCILEPGSRVPYFGPVKDKLKDIVNDNLLPMLQFAPEGLVKRHKSEHRWTIGESELRLYALERAHIDAARGINAKGLIVIEEGGFVSSEDFKYAYESVIRAMRLRHKPRIRIVTTPSEDEDHYIHTVIMPRCAASGSLSRYTIYDNPFLTPDEIEEIRKEVTEETWRREFLAEVFRSQEYAAVPEYKDEEHEFEPPTYAHWLTCIDFGGSMDPHAIALCYMEPKMDVLRVYREQLLPINTPISEIVAAAKGLEACIPLHTHDGGNDYEDRWWKAGDPKGSHTRIVDCQGQVSVELAALGFDHATPSKGPGSFDAHLQALRVAFQNKRITVHRDCEITREHLRRGRLNKQKTDFDRLEDATGQQHHCDFIAALMYGYRIRRTDDPTPTYQDKSPATHMLIKKQSVERVREISKMFEFDDWE
jgi:hypothetical protein